MSALARLLPDGRLHLQHGPIDLIVDAVAALPHPPLQGEGRTGGPGWGGGLDASPSPGKSAEAAPPHPTGFAGDPPPPGEGDAVRLAYAAATRRFATILDELCAELPALRRPARPDRCELSGAIARRMWAAVAPFAGERFITPMAAVAGAVAEAVLAAMTAAAPLRRAAVNNGGDIALHLAPGEHMRLGLVDRPDRPSLFGTAAIAAGDPVRGVATSGWRGRSFSFGIADAVTILAGTAAAADAAATIVANAVDLPGHPAVTRVPARDVQEDSDLGDRRVTRNVGPLAPGEIEAALATGLARAEELAAQGLIGAAALHLQGQTVTTRALMPPSHSRRHAEERRAAPRLEANATAGACFETAGHADLLSMTPSGRVEKPLEAQEIAA